MDPARRPVAAHRRHRRVAVVGGGPGGLLVARLVRLARPDWHVTTYEHNTAEDTYGFGVGLTPNTLDNLQRADPETAEDVVRAGHRSDGVLMQVAPDGQPSATTTLDGPGGAVAIGRRDLLRILRIRAQEAGVEVRTGTHAELPGLDADLVVAADGHASPIRTQLAGRLGAKVHRGRVLYLWCGTDFALPRATFAPAHTEHGTFVVHAYPYAPDRSTFLVETDESTWRAAGLDAADRSTPAGASDTASLDYLQHVFADLLQGRPLLGNRSRWQRFATVSTRQWSTGRVVLLGDAAHTAHYSIGSGTKLALEDAIALATALSDQDDLTVALAAHERSRRPAVERFQALASSSSDWWESFPRRLDQGADRVTVSYMTRAGNVDFAEFTRRHPDVVARAARDFARQAPPPAAATDLDALTDWVLHRPFTAGCVSTSSRVVPPGDADGWSTHGPKAPLRVAPLRGPADDPWGPPGDAAVEQARRLRDDGAHVLWIDGPGPSVPTTSRLALAERVRLDTRTPVGIDLLAEQRGEATAALLAGRVDLVRFRSSDSTAARPGSASAGHHTDGTTDMKVTA